MLPHVDPKKMPTYDKFVGAKSEPPRRKTPQEIEAIGVRWHHALNAQVNRRKGPPSTPPSSVVPSPRK